MASYGGANIRKDGLVFLLDAASPRSFLGTPTTNLMRKDSDLTGTQYAPNDEFYTNVLSKTYNSQMLTPVGAGATLISEIAVTGFQLLSRIGGGETSNLHSISCYIFPVTTNLTNVVIGMANDTGNVVTFDLTTKTITYGGSIDNRNAFLESVKGFPGWFRIGANIEGRPGGWIGSIGLNGISSYTGVAGARAAYIAGVQYEYTAAPTHFIAAGATRNAAPDSVSGWKDLSSNANHGTLVGAPTFSRVYNGGVNFDGTTQSVTIQYAAGSMDFSAAQSIAMWLKPGTGASSVRRNPYNHAYGGSGTITHETNGTFSYFFGTAGTNNLPYYAVNSTFTVAENELACIVVVRNQANNIVSWYKNGKFVASDNAAGLTATTNTTTQITLGNGYTNRFIGDIYFTAVYNKPITASEVAQLYNATRRRFGY